MNLWVSFPDPGLYCLNHNLILFFLAESPIVRERET